MLNQDRAVEKKLFDRDYAKTMYTNTKNGTWKTKFYALRSECRALTRLKKSNFYVQNEAIIHSKPKKFWSNMKKIIPKVNLKSIPKSLSPDTFNKYFVNVPV